MKAILLPLVSTKQLNVDVDSFNNYGRLMIFDRLQAPTAGRSITEGLEEAAMPAVDTCFSPDARQGTPICARIQNPQV